MFPTFDKQADIPKGFEGAYEERDGKWHAKVPDAAKLEETLTKVRGEKKTAEKALAEATEKAADLQRQLDVANAKGGESDKKVADALERWNKDKDAAVKKVQDKLDAATEQLRTVNLYDKAKQAFIAAGGRPEKADAALKLKKEHLDLADDQIVIKNAKGEVTTTKVEDFWKVEFKKEQPEFFTGSKAEGGGAGGGGGGAGSGALSAEELLKNPARAFEVANKAAAA